MNYRKNKSFSAWVLCTIGMFFTIFTLGNISAVEASSTDIPRIYLGYIFTNHHAPLMAALEKGEDFKSSGVWFKPMVDRQKYQLVNQQGNTIAIVNLIVSKSGSETATLFAQGRMDIGLASSTAFIGGIDKGTSMKILCPLHVDGLSMVLPKDSTLSGWADVYSFIKKSERPVKIGYHSPTSAPRIVFESALREAGLNVTENATDQDADVLLVDLKSTSNLIPALVSKQVDAWVGPSPYPAVAEYKKVGHIAINSRELPPSGQWHDFPCCVMGASDDFIAKHPDIVQAMTDLMVTASSWCNTHKAATAKIVSGWMGVPEEAAEKSAIIYTANPSKNWMRGEGVFLKILDNMHKLKGSFQGKELKDVEKEIYDFRFIHSSLENLQQ